MTYLNFHMKKKTYFPCCNKDLVRNNDVDNAEQMKKMYQENNNINYIEPLCKGFPIHLSKQLDIYMSQFKQ